MTRRILTTKLPFLLFIKLFGLTFEQIYISIMKINTIYDRVYLQSIEPLLPLVFSFSERLLILKSINQRIQCCCLIVL